MASKSNVKIVVSLMVVLLMGSIVLDGFTVVQPGERGVVVRMGHVTGESFDEGLHIKMPIVDRIDDMSVQIKKFSAPDMQASSKDLQTVRTSCAVNYRLNPSMVAQIRQQIGVQQGVHERTALEPQLQESIKAVTAKYNAQDLIAKRGLVSQEMRATFQKKLDNLVDGGFVVDEFSITDFRFSQTFTRAIEAKVEANERAMQAENEVRQTKAEAEKQVAQAHGEAESVRIDAQARADAKRLAAQAEADALRLEAQAQADATLMAAKAEAEAIQLRAGATREYPEVLQLDTVKTWDGKLPLVVGGKDGASPQLLLNLPSPPAHSKVK